MKAILKNILGVMFALIFSNMGFTQSLNWAIEFAHTPNVNPGSIFKSDQNGNHFCYTEGQNVAGYLDLDPGENEFFVYETNGPNEHSRIITKFNAQGEFVHAICLSGLRGYATTMIIDNLGNILIVGGFGLTDFDPGEAENIQQSEDGWDTFVAKYDNDLNLIWVNTYSDQGLGFSPHYLVLTSDSNGNIYFGGQIEGSFDADSGPNTLYLDYSELRAFIIKLDSDGNTLLAKQFETNNEDVTDGSSWILNMVVDSNDNLITSGQHHASLNVDPGNSDYVIGDFNPSPRRRFYAKYNSNLELIWAHSTPHVAGVFTNSDLILDDENNIYFACELDNIVDLDPGPDIHEINGIWNYYCIVKYNSDGGFVWAQPFHFAELRNIALDLDNDLIVTGKLSGDIDPGPGILDLGAEEEIFIAQFDSEDGHLLSAFYLDSEPNTQYTVSRDISVDEHNNIVVFGSYLGTIDMDPSPESHIFESPGILNNMYVHPVFIASFSQDPCDVLDIQILSVDEINCTDLEANVTLAINSGEAPFEIIWSDGTINELSMQVTVPGWHSVTVMDANACEKTRTFYVDGPSTDSGFDHEPALFTWGTFAPGFDNLVQLISVNNGCLPSSGEVQLEFPSFLTPTLVNPAPDYSDENLLSWEFDEISYQNGGFSAEINFSVLADENLLGTVFDLNVSTNPIPEDLEASNNTKTYQFEVYGAYDPNDKQVHPTGLGEEGFILNNQTLTYTIRFQNTGTAAATNVRIEDLIDNDLDLSTFNVINASHDMFVEILDNNTLNFHFNNIMLPDSNANEPESHGYVVYSIAQNADLIPGTEINNTASIYFDFNSPIITNTVLNTIFDPIGIDQHLSEELISIYPNPANSFITLHIEETYLDGNVCVYSYDGSLQQKHQLFGEQMTIDIQSLNTGMYLLLIFDKLGLQKAFKFIKN